MWERVTQLLERRLENMVGKRKKKERKHFVLFPHFLPLPKNKKIFSFSFAFILSSANAFNFDQFQVIGTRMLFGRGTNGHRAIVMALCPSICPSIHLSVVNLWMQISFIILFMIDLYKDNRACVCKLFL